MIQDIFMAAIKNPIQFTMGICTVCIVSGWFIGFWAGRIESKKLIEKLSERVYQIILENRTKLYEKDTKSN